MEGEFFSSPLLGTCEHDRPQYQMQAPKETARDSNGTILSYTRNESETQHAPSWKQRVIPGTQLVWRPGEFWELGHQQGFSKPSTWAGAMEGGIKQPLGCWIRLWLWLWPGRCACWLSCYITRAQGTLVAPDSPQGATSLVNDYKSSKPHNREKEKVEKPT